MRKVFILLFIVALSGCQDIQPIPVPEDLIPETDMEHILYDIAIINAARGQNVQKLKKLGVSPDNYVFEKYNIDSLQLAQSITYYAQDLVGYRLLNERVEKRITLKHAKNDSIQKVEQKVKDSIRKVKTAQARKNDSIRKARRDSLNKPYSSFSPVRQQQR